jgi:hypothetical protein
MTEKDFKVKYHEDSKGTVRRDTRKVRMSKKERLRRRWEGRENERFPIKTGRGNVVIEDVEKVKEYLRGIFPGKARQMDIAICTGIEESRVLGILNLLSGVSEDKKDDGSEFMPKDFLIFQDDEGRDTRFGIWKDAKTGIKNGICP